MSFLSHRRTGDFLFFPRNGLSDSITTCSVPQEIKEERDRARLDSMVLLIMKLDQLDQDIENALSTSSSPSSTPTNLRRHVLVSFALLFPWAWYVFTAYSPPCKWNISDGSIYPHVILIVFTKITQLILSFMKRPLREMCASKENSYYQFNRKEGHPGKLCLLPMKSFSL